MIRLTLLILALAASTFAADPPELIAARTQFVRADRELNEAWAAAKAKLPPARFDELKSIQRDWIAFRDQRAAAAGSAAQPDMRKPKDGLAYFTTLVRLVDDRTGFLRRLVAGGEESLTGLWIDGQGGTVEIVEQKGRLLFDFNVVRGQSFDLGVLAGAARWNQRIGWFSDQGRDPEKKDETNIAWVRDDLYLRVTTANAQHYHGKRAHFDGVYFQAASLTAEEKAAVVKAGESGKSSAQE